MESYQIIWNNALKELQKSVSTIHYDVLKTYEAIDLDGSKLILLAKTSTFFDTVKTKLTDKILDVLKKLNTGITQVDIFVGTNKEDYIASSSMEITEADGSPLNPNYTFEKFVVGESNRMCYSAAKAVSDAPSEAYNPLFIHGSSGLGKTHLLHSIANSLKITHPKKKVLYVTSEQFFSEFINIIRTGKAYADASALSFKNKYRSVDVLIVDDVQTLTSKQQSMEEFFHTFNALYAENKQIILSADRKPKELDMDTRLITRFEGGLITEVLPPDIETKIAILQKKAQDKKHILSLEVASYIAEVSEDNVRSLEGLLNKVIFASQLNEKPITLSLAMDALKESVTSENTETITASRVIDIVCAYYKIDKSDLLSKKRDRELVEPRQICCYLLTELTSIPLMTIGQAIGKNHATVIHSRDKINELIGIDKRIESEVKDLKNLILKK